MTTDTAPATPERIEELTASCIRFVHATTGLQLDLTHETLPILDHYTRLSRTELATRPEAGPLIAQASGAYFGQVLAIEFGGLWRAMNADVHEWQLYFQPQFLLLNPVGIAYDVLFEGGTHDGPSADLRFARDERALVEARLNALPEVSHDDYFTFSTRFDVVQIAVEALRGLQQTAEASDVNYEWGDYEDEFLLG
jgi:hypothetical protein